MHLPSSPLIMSINDFKNIISYALYESGGTVDNFNIVSVFHVIRKAIRFECHDRPCTCGALLEKMQIVLPHIVSPSTGDTMYRLGLTVFGCLDDHQRQILALMATSISQAAASALAQQRQMAELRQSSTFSAVTKRLPAARKKTKKKTGKK